LPNNLQRTVFNVTVAAVDDVLDVIQFLGIIHVSLLIPDYRIDGIEVDDPSNYIKRSPFPNLYLLRSWTCPKRSTVTQTRALFDGGVVLSFGTVST
ncbi:MAG: hypothetical protein ACI9OJ_005691, partial [Myxococcota bacterium]